MMILACLRQPMWIFVFLTGAVVSRIWVAEDAYITFRMVENLYAGYGLVFNPSERIEASTHPLWLLLLILVRGAGLPLHSGSILLGLCFSLMGLFLLARDRLAKGQIPWAALALASISGFRDFATAGMEFSLVFLLLVLLCRSLADDSWLVQPARSGLILALLYLTRPELALLTMYYGAWFLYARWRKDSKLADLLLNGMRFAFPFVIALIYHTFRWFYYNDLLPNTYYAKAGLASYFSQGLVYLVYTVLWSPSLLLLGLAAAIILLLVARRKGAASLLPWTRESGAILLLVFYAVNVGGDFMAFRFLLPQIVFFVIFAERILVTRPTEIPFLGTKWTGPAIQPFALFLALLLTLYPVPLSRGFVADERKIFTRETDSIFSLIRGENFSWGRAGREFRTLQYCLNYEPFKITNSMTQARCSQGVGLGYFGVAAGPAVEILDEQGLPSRDVALRRVIWRWRPGHEHYISFSDVLASGALFCSTGEVEYDRIMRTPAGVLLSLDPEIFWTLPDAEVRLKSLRELRPRSTILPVIEKRFQNLDALEASRQRSEPRYHARAQCWEEFSNDLAAF
ncbi:MAG: hypothetical protein HS115_17880 [Spirochaetales bacterium]|nr:hypothetical protein [Spirochaetales bacterium]